MTSQPQKKRKHSPSPGVEWKEKWNSDSFKSGRVLMLDYVSRDFSEDGRRRILANELRDIDQLRHFYRYEEPKRHPALRVIHVQNSWWARRFLLRKFNIDPTDDLIGMSFGKWAAFTTPQRRAGRPMLNGKAFRNQRDPWRGISRCAFGVDYLKYYHCGQCDPSKDGFKMMELNGFDTKGDPAYLNDVYVQRISVYVQKNDGEPRVPTDPDLRNPYSTTETEEQDRIRRRYSKMAREADLQADDYVPILKSLDNSRLFERFTIRLATHDRLQILPSSSLKTPRQEALKIPSSEQGRRSKIGGAALHSTCRKRSLTRSNWPLNA